MRDNIEQMGRSLVQHGPFSDRAYLMKLDLRDGPAIAEKLIRLARTHGYTKVFAKVPESAQILFQDSGFEIEARVPGMICAEEPVFFMSRFLSENRRQDPNAGRIQEVLGVAQKKAATPPAGFGQGDAEALGSDDAEEMAALYRSIFASYPFPIHDPAYLRKTMQENVRFFGCRLDGRIAALASGEMDRNGQNAEMTDFATLPACRGKKLAQGLLAHMEQALAQEGIQTAFTIARAISYGMNIVFARAGYTYGGTLVNNTQIAGGIESMNVWYKPL